MSRVDEHGSFSLILLTGIEIRNTQHNFYLFKEIPIFFTIRIFISHKICNIILFSPFQDCRPHVWLPPSPCCSGWSKFSPQACHLFCLHLRFSKQTCQGGRIPGRLRLQQGQQSHPEWHLPHSPCSRGLPPPSQSPVPMSPEPGGHSH